MPIKITSSDKFADIFFRICEDKDINAEDILSKFVDFFNSSANNPSAKQAPAASQTPAVCEQITIVNVAGELDRVPQSTFFPSMTDLVER
jgi:hypothetical protein